MRLAKRLYLSINDHLKLITKTLRKIKACSNSNANISLVEAFSMIVTEAVQRINRKRHMKNLALEVLLKYDLNIEKIRYISESVNTVFQVEVEGQKYSLIIHPPNQRTLTEIQAEILWLLALRTEKRLEVPEPIKARDGTYIQKVPDPKVSNQHHMVLFTWLDGTPLYNNLTPATMELAGSFIASLHNHAKQFQLPEGVSRQHINWNETWVWMDENYIRPNSLTTEDYNLCVTTSSAVLKKIDCYTKDSNYGLIHFDLHPWNILLHRDVIQVIDFDECQYAPFLFDMAVPLSYLTERQDYEELKAGFLKGYSHERSLPQNYETGLELFMTVCHLNMIAWILSWPTISYKEFGPKFLENSLTQIKRLNKNVK